MPHKSFLNGWSASLSEAGPPGFTCWCSDSGDGAAWVHVAGELELVASLRLEWALHQAELNARTVVLDLRALSSIGYPGVHVIAEAAARAQEDDRRLMIVRGAPHVDKMLALMGTAHELNIFDLKPVDFSEDEPPLYGYEPAWARGSLVRDQKTPASDSRSQA